MTDKPISFSPLTLLISSCLFYKALSCALSLSLFIIFSCALFFILEMNSTNPNITLDLGPVNPDTYEMASELISLTCITALATALGAKTFGEKLKTLNYGRALVILLYTLSWAFAATSVVIVSTNNRKWHVHSL